MLSSATEYAPALYDLARPDLPNYRASRYRGTDVCVSITQFCQDDQQRLRTLYGVLQRLHRILTAERAAAEAPALLAFLRERMGEELVRLATKLGTDSYAALSTPEMAKTIHDVRGGGLTPLVGELMLAGRRGLRSGTREALFYLTRDHLKIMRNALLGLDDEGRARDLQPRAHSTALLVEKWHGAKLHEGDREVRLEVDCRLTEAIGECCMEFGALDRILYNLINNACRHTPAGSARLVIFPVPDDAGEILRFVVLNEVTSLERTALAGRDLAALFQEGTSTTGSGYGLAIVNEFVSHAFGLRDKNETLEEGYLGARLVEDVFAVWFHWPRLVK